MNKTVYVTLPDNNGHFIDINTIEDRDPIEVYTQLVNSWIFNPAEILAVQRALDPNTGMMLLASLLMFFEPHGQYLSGESSQRKSKYTFCLSFSKFLDHLLENNHIEEETFDRISPEDIYKLARCGLFHSMSLSKNLLIDAHNTSQTVFALTHQNTAQAILINPWLLLPRLREYFLSYITLLENDDLALKRRFNLTYTRLVLQPLREIAGR